VLFGEAQPYAYGSNDTAGSPPEQLKSALTTVKQLTHHGAASVGDLLHVFGRRAYGPVLFVIGLIALSPLGAIPGASVVCATLAGC